MSRARADDAAGERRLRRRAASALRRHADRPCGRRGRAAGRLSRRSSLAHAWLIGGPEGVGKATLAWRFARFVLAHPDPTRRRVREPRRSRRRRRPSRRRGSSAALAHPDFALRPARLEPEVEELLHAKSASTTCATRCRSSSCRRPSAAGAICIVDSADDLNRSGANALLKMIEEPPPRSLILIVAHRPGQVLPTIRSRCRRLMLEPLRPAEIGEFVAGARATLERVAPAASTGAAARADGSVREALRRLDPECAADRRADRRDAGAIARRRLRDVHKLADAVGGRGAGDAFDGFRPRSTIGSRRAHATRGSPRVRRSPSYGTRIRAATRETEASISTANCMSWRCSRNSPPPRARL